MHAFINIMYLSSSIVHFGFYAHDFLCVPSTSRVTLPNDLVHFPINKESVGLFPRVRINENIPKRPCVIKSVTSSLVFFRCHFATFVL